MSDHVPSKIHDSITIHPIQSAKTCHAMCPDGLLPKVICVGTRTERCTAKRRWANAPTRPHPPRADDLTQDLRWTNQHAAMCISLKPSWPSWGIHGIQWYPEKPPGFLWNQVKILPLRSLQVYWFIYFILSLCWRFGGHGHQNDSSHHFWLSQNRFVHDFFVGENVTVVTCSLFNQTIFPPLNINFMGFSPLFPIFPQDNVGLPDFQIAGCLLDAPGRHCSVKQLLRSTPHSGGSRDIAPVRLWYTKNMTKHMASVTNIIDPIKRCHWTFKLNDLHTGNQGIRSLGVRLSPVGPLGLCEWPIICGILCATCM